jgi:acetylornithine deacetylase
MSFESHPEYEPAKHLMDVMVERSQRPGTDNEAFVEHVGEALDDAGLEVERVPDPDYPDRALRVAHSGDPEGRQTLAGISHADVVGIDGQDWKTDAFKLTEDGEYWYGRGVCDTHGSGVGMALAALRPEVSEALRAEGAYISIVFTYDEEATDQEFSMRGAKVATGATDQPAVIETPFFIAGEPTERDGRMVPMRGHKGRFLAHFEVHSPHSGHVSEVVDNALMRGSSIVHELSTYYRVIRYGSGDDVEAEIFDPPHTTLQVSAARVKSGEYSSTPEHASFTLDMRTLPFAEGPEKTSTIHDRRVLEVSDLIQHYDGIGEHETVTLEVEKNAPGSMTAADSPIVTLAEAVTGASARGFNGGDEGRILRLQGNKQGITLGPGELSQAHVPNERIAVQSVLNSADVYAELFKRSVSLTEPEST